MSESEQTLVDLFASQSIELFIQKRVAERFLNEWIRERARNEILEQQLAEMRVGRLQERV